MIPNIQQRIAQFRRGEIPDGYKRGKLGIVPVEWGDVPFSSLFVSTSDYTDDLETYPLYSLTLEDGITAKTERYDRSHLVKKSESYKIVRPNDFAYNPMNIRLGAVARHKGAFPVAVSGYYDIFTTVSPDDLAFMDSFLTCAPMITYYNKVSTGSLLEKQRVHFSQFLEFSLPLPPLEERKKIGAILSAQDTIIELKERLLTEKRRQKKYLMQQLFEKFHGKKRKIKDICEILGGGTPDTRKAEYWNGEILWCTPSDFSKSGTKYINSTEKRISQLGLKSSSATMLPVGAVLLCTRATVGEARIASRPICTNQGFQSMIANPGISNEWLYYLVQYIKSDIIKLASGSTFLEISKNNLSNIVISVPFLEIQLKIADILSAADREIHLLQASVEQEKRKKKALSQLLLTGIVRCISNE